MPREISPRSALILIVIAQFLGTSLWFAGNAAAGEWEVLLKKEGIIPILTSVVQLGFISGTFSYAFWSIPDRFSPSKVFLISGLLAASSNLAILIFPLNYPGLLVCRFMVGFFLAGIYPVGMKIAADYFEKGLGTALGFLVGALVLGTAFPFLLKALEWGISWQNLILATSSFAVIGAFIIGLKVPDGPFRKKNPKLDLSLLPKFAKNMALKSAASGYFGHMWELYTFWAFLPVSVIYLTDSLPNSNIQFSWTFLIITAGAISCALGGLLSQKIGSQKVAWFSLMGSGICGLILWIIPTFPAILILPFLLIWGVLVSADSPQFSTLVAQSVAPEHRGTALTLVNCLGFALTVLSILLTGKLSQFLTPKVYLGILCLGPLIGLIFFNMFKTKKAS